MEYGNNKLRHELKYIINSFEYKVLSGRLKATLQADSHCNKNFEYTVRSLYFDDIYNCSMNEKLSGIDVREKFRIRIYNMDDSVIKLEKKSKFGQYTCKEAGLISPAQARSILNGSYGFMQYSENVVFRNFYCKAAASLFRPAVIVEYDREAYYHRCGNVRITFDKNLRTGLNSFDFFNRDITSAGVLDGHLMIMEIKYDSFCPGFLADIIRIPMRQRLSISKYVLCRIYNETGCVSSSNTG